MQLTLLAALMRGNRRAHGSIASAVPPSSVGPFAHVLGSGTSTDDQTVLVGKHPSAKYIFYANGGNDTTGNGTTGNPYATPQKAWSMITDGAGDWMLGAEGDTFSSWITSGNKNGLSSTYPLVVGTYDKTDPTNVAKYRRPTGLVTAAMAAEWVVGFSSCVNTLFENLSLSASSAVEWNFLNGLTGGDATKNLTFWNVRTTLNVQLSLQTDVQGADTGTARMRAVVARRCVLAWSQYQGVYAWKTDGLVIEDSILWHNGWNGTTRTNGTKNPSILEHNAYMGVANDNLNFRRNVSMDASSHGLQARGGGSMTKNVFFRNPLDVLIGGGNFHNTIRPLGVPYVFDDNLVIDSDDLDPANERGNGVQFTNTNNDAGNHANRNLIIWRRTGSSPDSPAWVAKATDGFNVPAWCVGDQNTIFNFGTMGIVEAASSPLAEFPSATHYVLTRCILPNDTPSGSNVATPTVAHPNTTLDMTSFATSRGYGSIAALQAGMVANPLTDWANLIREHVVPGYSFQQ